MCPQKRPTYSKCVRGDNGGRAGNGGDNGIGGGGDGAGVAIVVVAVQWWRRSNIENLH
jgi:hypothetical protein